MRSRDVRSLIAACIVLAVMAVVAGCGGGGGASSVVGSPGVTLTVGTNALFQPTSLTRDGVAVGAALDAGAVVEVFNFATGQKIASGTIGTNGTAEVKITSGLSVVVVVTGSRGGKNYRLSAIIPSVPVVDTVVTADPLSTIASEAIAATHYKKGTVIDEATLETVKTAAQAFLTANSTADLSIGAGLVSGTQFGAQGALDAQQLAAVIGSVPATINSAVVKAKNAVQQIKEAGLPWKMIIDQERPSLDSVYEACETAIGESSVNVVVDKYRQLGDRLSLLILPAIRGDLASGYDTVGIADLQMGKGYRATKNTQYGWSWIEITPEDAYDVVGKIVIKLEDGGATYVVTATKPTASTWSITQTSNADAQMSYKATIPSELPTGANPSISASISIADQYITTPIKFDGTLSAVGSSQAHYSSISCNGTLTSDVVNAQGKFQANFPASAPSGTLPSGGIYALPTSYSMTDASCRVADGTSSIQISGAISVQNEPKSCFGILRALPTDLRLTNGSISVVSGNKSVVLTGNIIAKTGWRVASFGSDAYGGNEVMLPTEFTLTDASLTAKNGTHTIKCSGSIAATAQVKSVSGVLHSLPDYLKLHGEYSNSATELAFSGTIEGRWDNPAGDLSANAAKGTVSIVGQIDRKNYRAYEANVLFALDGAGNATCTVTKLGWGSMFVAGVGTARITASGQAQDGTLELQNQDGVKFVIGDDATGPVSVGAEQVGSLSRENGLLKIAFSDGTHDYLP